MFGLSSVNSLIKHSQLLTEFYNKTDVLDDSTVLLNNKVLKCAVSTMHRIKLIKTKVLFSHRFNKFIPLAFSFHTSGSENLSVLNPNSSAKDAKLLKTNVTDCALLLQSYIVVSHMEKVFFGRKVSHIDIFCAQTWQKVDSIVLDSPEGHRTRGRLYTHKHWVFQVALNKTTLQVFQYNFITKTHRRFECSLPKRGTGWETRQFIWMQSFNAVDDRYIYLWQFVPYVLFEMPNPDDCLEHHWYVLFKIDYKEPALLQYEIDELPNVSSWKNPIFVYNDKTIHFGSSHHIPPVKHACVLRMNKRTA